MRGRKSKSARPSACNAGWSPSCNHSLTADAVPQKDARYELDLLGTPVCWAGITRVDSNVATAIRTSVIVVLTWAIVFARKGTVTIPPFILFSGWIWLSIIQ